jgi:hypothetical protein
MELGKQSIRNLGVYGLIRQAEVDDYLIPDGAVTDALNVHFDRKGAVQSRPGVTAIGSSVSINPCIGLFNSQSSVAVAAFIGGTMVGVYGYLSGAWATIYTQPHGATAIRFVDFANRMIQISGLTSSITSWKVNAPGASYTESSGNPINPQNLWYVNGNTNGGYICPQYGEVYKSRVYLSGDTNFQGFGSRLWFSSVITASGSITWNPSVDYVDINPSDGENITGLKRYVTELLVFKPSYTYHFTTSGVDPDPWTRVGTRSQESIIEGKSGLYFFHDSGFYRYAGGYPVEISRPISDIVANVPFSQFSNIAAWKDNDHIYWSMGDITVQGKKMSALYKNAVLRYTESSDLWTMYSYPFTINRGAPFISGTSSSIMVGLSTGVVGEFNKGITDVGQPINYRMVTRWFEWGGIENRKEIQQLIGVTEKGLSAQLMYQIDEYEDWQALNPALSDLLTFFDKNTSKFHRIRFKLTGVISSESLVFLGIEVPQATYEYIKNG